MQVRPTGTTGGMSLYWEMETPLDMCLVEAQRECVLQYIASTNMVRFPHGFEVSIKRPMAPPERPQGEPMPAERQATPLGLRPEGTQTTSPSPRSSRWRIGGWVKTL